MLVNYLIRFRFNNCMRRLEIIKNILNCHRLFNKINQRRRRGTRLSLKSILLDTMQMSGSWGLMAI
jgi:hypothetical protein